MSHLLRAAIARCQYLTSAFAFSLVFACGVRGETPTASDFPGLAAACKPVEKFVAGTTIVVEKAGQAESPAPLPSRDLSPALSRMFAFEENARFLCAVGDASQLVAGRPAPQDDSAKPIVVRRVLVLKPSVFLIDDLIVKPAADDVVKWRIHCQSEPEIADNEILLDAGDEHLLCQTLWPASVGFQKVAGAARGSDPVVETALPGGDEKQVVRCLHLLQVRATAEIPSGAAAFDLKDGTLKLKLITDSDVYDLILPPPGTAAGWISLQTADGKTVIPHRPLPAGILPHGPDGMRLIERWDRSYRDGRTPAWDTGVPAPALEKAVEDGAVKPCRTVVLGCGSGTNAIYLAKKGFDVTAIDVAPTALAIAEEKAQKAGVEVNWLLADVLALPKLERFDFVFDRGCYHNVRYVDAAGFMASLKQVCKLGGQLLILSLNRDGPPGVREQTMRDDFSSSYEFVWLREGGIRTGRSGQTPRQSWSLMLKRKSAY